MAKHFCFLAQLDGLNPLNPTAPLGKSTGLVFQDVLVILATGLALGLILLLWTRYYLRKKERRRHPHHHERRVDPPPAPALNNEGRDEEHHHHGRRRRRRRRRHDHRPRNPTLAETGGLPPSKTEPSSNPPL